MFKQHDFRREQGSSAENRFGSLKFALGPDPFMPLGKTFNTVSWIVFVFGHETDDFVAAFRRLPDNSGNRNRTAQPGTYA